jgi:ATP-dependent RNA circularization protein (DNA/RNA ligase family)
MKAWCNKQGKGLIIQGEAVGHGIQGNKYHKNCVDFYVFNVAEYHKGQTEYYDQPRQSLFCVKFDLTTVPILWSYTSIFPSIPEMVSVSQGQSREYDIPREGIVVRNYPNNISFKVINPNFLLKYNE